MYDFDLENNPASVWYDPDPVYDWANDQEVSF